MTSNPEVGSGWNGARIMMRPSTSIGSYSDSHWAFNSRILQKWFQLSRSPWTPARQSLRAFLAIPLRFTGKATSPYRIFEHGKTATVQVSHCDLRRQHRSSTSSRRKKRSVFSMLLVLFRSSDDGKEVRDIKRGATNQSAVNVWLSKVHRHCLARYPRKGFGNFGRSLHRIAL